MKYVGKSATGGEVYCKSPEEDKIRRLSRANLLHVLGDNAGLDDDSKSDAELRNIAVQAVREGNKWILEDLRRYAR